MGASPDFSGLIAPASAGDAYAALRLGLFSPPDRQSFDVTPRRRKAALVTAAALPIGNTTVSVNIPLDTLNPDDGLLIEYVGGLLSVAPGAGATVTIRDVLFALTAAGATFSQAILPLSTPVLTTLTPLAQDTLNFPPVPLVSARDLDEMARALGLVSIFGTSSQPLALLLTITYNDTVAASTVTQKLVAMYRVVHGLSGA